MKACRYYVKACLVFEESPGDRACKIGRGMQESRQGLPRVSDAVHPRPKTPRSEHQTRGRCNLEINAAAGKHNRKENDLDLS